MENVLDWLLLSMTPLRLVELHVASLRALLDAGGRASKAKSHGITTLHSAVANGNRAVIRILLEVRSDVDAK